MKKRGFAVSDGEIGTHTWSHDLSGPLARAHPRVGDRLGRFEDTVLMVLR